MTIILRLDLQQHKLFAITICYASVVFLLATGGCAHNPPGFTLTQLRVALDSAASDRDQSKELLARATTATQEIEQAVTKLKTTTTTVESMSRTIK